MIIYTNSKFIEGRRIKINKFNKKVFNLNLKFEIYLISFTINKNNLLCIK